MMQTTLSLPRCKLECRRCHRKWIAAVARFTRGHALLQRGEQRVFIPDDICYEVNESIDFRAIMSPLGYCDYRTDCSKCGRDDAVFMVRSLLDSSDFGYESFRCVALQSADFLKDESGWRLADEAAHALG